MRWFVRKCQSRCAAFCARPVSVAVKRRPHEEHWFGCASYRALTREGLNVLRLAWERAILGFRCGIDDGWVAATAGVPKFARPGKLDSDLRISAAVCCGGGASAEGMGVGAEGAARPAARKASIRAVALPGGAAGTAAAVRGDWGRF